MNIYIFRFRNILLKFTKQVFIPQTVFLRTYQTVLSKELPISQFCTILLKCPYDVNIKPIDVFQNQDKAFITINTTSNAKVPDVICNYNNDILSIDVVGSDNNNDFTLNIDTSIKASSYTKLCVFCYTYMLIILDVHIEGDNNINIGNFYGKYIKAYTKHGHINLAKSQCEIIRLITDNGDIVCKDVIQAGDITLKIQNSGVRTFL